MKHDALFLNPLSKHYISLHNYPKEQYLDKSLFVHTKLQKDYSKQLREKYNITEVSSKDLIIINPATV